MLCMTFFFCAPLQSAGGFILEGDWTPTKTNLYYSPPIEVGVSSTFKMNCELPVVFSFFYGIRQKGVIKYVLRIATKKKVKQPKHFNTG